MNFPKFELRVAVKGPVGLRTFCLMYVLIPNLDNNRCKRGNLGGKDLIIRELFLWFKFI